MKDCAGVRKAKAELDVGVYFSFRDTNRRPQQSLGCRARDQGGFRLLIGFCDEFYAYIVKLKSCK